MLRRFAIVCAFTVACGFRSPLRSGQATSSEPGAGQGGVVAASGGQLANSGGSVATQGGAGGTSSATAPLCGNKVLDPGEECDDGNRVPGDGCDEYCRHTPERFRSCGNGLMDPGEQCDDGNRMSGDGCTDKCCIEDYWTPPCFGAPIGGRLCCATRIPCFCGNGLLEAGEVCDDGNRQDGDGCSRYCQLEPAGTCPNGVLDEHEECDDGNTIALDGCDERCRKEVCIGFARCGDGIQQAGEECDTAGDISEIPCTGDCRIANTLTNGDFETGTLQDWTPVGRAASVKQTVVPYAEMPSLSPKSVAVNPPANGGSYCAYVRTGDNIELGFEQTVTVHSGRRYAYYADFLLREVQIPGDPRSTQTVELSMNGSVVASYVSGTLAEPEYGSFVGPYMPDSNRVTVRIAAVRATAVGTGFGQMCLDNVRLVEQ